MREQNQSTTRQITTAIASGSTEAFATFYELWFDRCLESTMRMTGFDEATALDVVQDTMMKVATQLPRFDEEGQLRAWLDRVLLNASRDRIRAEARRRKREQRPVRTELERMPHEQLEELDRHLGTLDEQQRSILRLRFSLGWSLQKIGNALRLGGPGSVDGRIRRALEKLRSEYQAEEIDHDQRA
ncbi:MAG: sigma-70 family RNA polymerase sigma factor [Phycisphaerales bacterium]|nr:sigma-70 family RNA polymerase sigma factor [Phycisphaerales bacterium]